MAETSQTRSHIHLFVNGVVGLLLFLAPANATNSASSPLANTTCGSVKGVMWPTLSNHSYISAFLGIPYAKPPTGDRRWQPPESLNAKCWKDSIFNATEPGPACLQKGRYSNDANSEDCLRLHVWTANLPNNGQVEDGTLNPVIVWLHGGDLVEGSAMAIESGYGAVANLTDSNKAVVVAVEYRLGVAGFLALDVLATRDTRGSGLVGNYGLLDVIKSLEWVQNNIRNFGGDPRRVTVMGQSSGGSLVFALLASPYASGLFAQGISLSGSPRMNSTTQEAATYWHQEVIHRTRCVPVKANKPALSACLLSLNATEMIAAMPPDWTANAFSFDVFRDDFQYAPLLLVDGPGGVLPVDYIKASTSAKASNTSLIVGVTRQEADFSPGDDVRNLSKPQFSQFIQDRIGPFYNKSFVDELVSLYVIGDDDDNFFEPQQLYASIVTDATILCPNMYLASKLQQSSSVDVRMYAASYRMQNPFCVLEPFNTFAPPYCPLYSFHAIDMFALFNVPYSINPLTSFNYTQTQHDLACGSLIRDRFLSFANNSSNMSWPFFGDGHASDIDKDKDFLPSTYTVIDLASVDAAVFRFKVKECTFWLENNFYERKGLIN
eukprot:m.174462 g.174462  ORF g.174462 m.174462 type:complete len:606 (-) comp31769_c0_seq1:64-1881(-)